MKLLLDTHIFLWFISSDAFGGHSQRRLLNTFIEIIRNTDNDVYLSIISIWEATVKYQLGKLPLPQSPEIYLPIQRERHLITSLPLTEDSVVQLSKLPNIHRDPFDRMLICQALQHDLTIVTVDDTIRAYPVKILNDT
ncbi:type II toxin-antitoxin system VapC family toxin [Nostoc sp.]|uniref:type II toxin-antitoxin system VapC family toxin n=1 Tax=Nostoc sp. TaxID=1180 RepID=UPI002FF5337B